MVTTVITYILGLNVDITKVIDSIGAVKEISKVTGIQKVGAFIINNGFEVPLQMLILAIIPIQFLYLLNVFIPSFITGIAFGIILQIDSVKGLQIIISSISYSIIEIFAFCLFAAVLFEVNQIIRIKIKNIFKKTKVKVSLISKFLEALKIYTMLVLPMMIIAAFLETYVADILFNLFQ
ncbi:MAG: stage II sporulation protein M [Carnobacterium sp.]